MDSEPINATLAELTASEFRFWNCFVDTRLRGGWIEEDEAVEWRLRILAWRQCRELDQEAASPQ
jgi:hypothetical protein